MAVKYTIGGPYAVCFPTKIRSGNCGHILNLTLQQDLENGTIRSAGDWIELDNYEVAREYFVPTRYIKDLASLL